jgi:hypothetical protein
MKDRRREDEQATLRWLNDLLDKAADDALNAMAKQAKECHRRLYGPLGAEFRAMDAWRGSLNKDGIVAVLSTGKASPEFLVFVAKELKSGRFAGRKTVVERWADAPFPWQAAYDLPDIKRLLAERDGQNSNIHERGLRFAVLRWIDEPKDETKVANAVEKLAQHVRRTKSRRLH